MFVTGSVGKTTTCRMTAAILAAAGKTVGLTTTTGCYVDGRPLRLGDSSGPRWAALVTADRRVDAAVLEMARGGILLDGMPFHGCDVGAVLNVLDDHLGIDGIHTRDQLAQVKSMVARKARRPRGHAAAATIREVLMAFRSDDSDNPGRMNLYRGMPYTLMATKAGGVAAGRAIAGFAREFDVSGRKKLVVCSVGNRPEDVLRSVGGAYAGAFDSYVCCDWEDRRGRPRGEAAGLLAAGLREAGVPEHAIEIVPDHDTAIRRAHAAVSADDLLVVASPTAARAPGILGAAAAA